MATPSRRTWSMGLFVYNPATNTLEGRWEIVPGLGGEIRPLVVGPNERIYGTGTRRFTWARSFSIPKPTRPSTAAHARAGPIHHDCFRNKLYSSGYAGGPLFVCDPTQPWTLGFIWTYLKDVLVRIDPEDARVHVVGKVDPVGSPTFVGNDVYLSGSEHLRRIRNLVKHSQATKAAN